MDVSLNGDFYDGSAIMFAFAKWHLVIRLRSGIVTRFERVTFPPFAAAFTKPVVTRVVVSYARERVFRVFG